ncbi:alpha/beta fold hydrolase [Tumebacillus permanentifrigoris]|uniref:Pimeloyl-ACP methyl ester carboxylesterase n=1 Tax=Tumebacillus permanentifrigoris TaxID=378543 RepID=A0A316D6L4_9BACL|nr:alpha/beta hydrolase [Tumebacillus permanentifrigoris]PWK07418.1 pimeloyl-ACP methyl ester carboxylesterase [Tumebacillus permanentifrigoris]
MELNGITLAYDVYEKQNAPVLVLIHGLASTKESYNRTIPFLTEKFHILSLDLRGHGESSQVGPYTNEQLVDDILEVLDYEGIEKATLVGGSFAGAPVQQFAAKYPDRVDKLVLLDGGFARNVEMPGADLEALQKREPFSTSTMEEMIAGVRQSYGEHVTDFVDEQTRRETVQKDDGRVYLALPHEAFVSYASEYFTFSLDELAATLKTPVLVLQAANRPEFYDTALQAYLEKFPLAQAVKIPNSPHPLMVSHPQEVADYIIRFTEGKSL